MYGKLAYKCTGPYKIVDVNPRNPDVYRLVPLGQPNREPTSHRVRELCPYVTQEAHERQKPAPVGIVEDDLLTARTPVTPAVPPEGPGVVYTQSPTRECPHFALKDPTRPA